MAISSECMRQKERKVKEMIIKDFGGASTPAINDMDFILKDGSTYILGVKKIEEYMATYPSVNVLQSLREARQWLIDNPRRRKTSRGMGRFFNNWLNNHNKKIYPSKTSKPKLADIDF